MIVAGIDVGGKPKGFHAVAFKDGAYHEQFSSTVAAEIAAWCRNTVQASVIGVDAPCRWSKNGRARTAERELMQEGIWCFSTPTEEMAKSHPTNHYGWMLNGAELFKLLETTHTLCNTIPIPVDQRQCFETFPHAITSALVQAPTSARNKRTVRRALLKETGIDTDKLSNIDFVDAALCALTAYYLAAGKPCKSYGEPDTGIIIAPDSLSSCRDRPAKYPPPSKHHGYKASSL